MIYRPIQNLRIGFAHTPTYYWIDRTYPGLHRFRVAQSITNDPDGLKPGQDGNQYTDALSPVLEDTGGYNWEFTTPARLMFGISYAFGNRSDLRGLRARLVQRDADEKQSRGRRQQNL